MSKSLKMFAIEWVHERIRKEEYFLSKHGDTERQNDDLTITEVEDALLAGRIIELFNNPFFGVQRHRIKENYDEH